MAAMSTVMTQQERHVIDLRGREYFRERVAATTVAQEVDGVSARGEEPRQKNHGSEAACNNS